MQPNRQTLPLLLTYQQYHKRGQKLQGFRLGQYTIIDQLGKGSFGIVYKAQNERGDIFALKLLDKKEVRNQKNRRIKEIRQRLIQSEPELMQQCDSPNLLKCYEIFENEDLKLLIMQYCDGLTLSEELKRLKKRNFNKPFSQKEAVDILRHIINGIAELHEHSIVHRDLKTDNIMKHQGIYKIIDFGFSKKLELTHQCEKTKNTILGTPTTMAPQVMFHKNYGLKADIWSIGIIFFEIVFGIPPYDSSNAKAFFQQIEKRFEGEKPSPFKGITLSQEAHDFLKKVLKVDPDNRIGWREMIQHPLIKVEQQQPLTDPFQERFPLNDPVVAKQLENGSLISRQLQFQEEIKEKRQHELSKYTSTTSKKQKEKQKYQEKGESKKHKQMVDLDKLMEQQKQEFIQKKKRQRSNYIQSQSIKKQTLIEESQINMRLTQVQQPKSKFPSKINQASQFSQCRQYHLQCLKSELIFKEIIEPLQSRSLIDLSKRESIEFMHLLISRCFKNLSPLKEKLKNPQKVHRSFRNLNSQVQSLYKQAAQKFKWYDQKLLELQNKHMQIAKDFFFKIFRNTSQQNKNKIIGGVQLREDIQSQFGDFTKAQQIQYTCLYIQRISPRILNLGRYSQKVKKHLRKYDQIMSLNLEMLGQYSFQSFVETILEK